MNKNQIFSAIKRGFEISGINALSMAASSPSVNKALQEMIDEGEPVEVCCHFCEKKYNFTQEELKNLKNPIDR